MYKTLCLFVLCGCLGMRVWASENIDALSVRVTELEKANYVLHEDLARTRIELDLALAMLRDSMGKVDTKVDTLKQQTLQELIEKVNAQKDEDQKQLDGFTAQLQKQRNDLLATIADRDAQTQNKVAAMLKMQKEDESLTDRLDLLEKRLEDARNVLGLKHGLPARASPKSRSDVDVEPAEKRVIPRAHREQREWRHHRLE